MVRRKCTPLHVLRVSSAEGTATFIAKISGDPIPSVKWMKGKWRQITPGGRISIEQKGQDAKMEIREVTKSDSGQYRCVATNKHGEIESSADLEVSKKEEAEGLGDIRTRLKKYGNMVMRNTHPAEAGARCTQTQHIGLRNNQNIVIRYKAIYHHELSSNTGDNVQAPPTEQHEHIEDIKLIQHIKQNNRAS